jgi:polyphosphate kinase
MSSLSHWDDYTEAKERMFEATDTDFAPWTVVKSNDKRRGRLNAMRYVLSNIEYEGKDFDIVGTPDPLIVGKAASVFEVNEGQRSKA